MKKNVITILIDSVFSECLGNGRTEISSTPFIDELISNGIFSKNVYSYGPYTDAATKGLYSGKPTLSDYGYYYGLNSTESYHFKTFKDNGYETFAFYYPCYLLGSKVRKNIDHSIFTAGFDFPAVWLGKYSYYSDKKKQRGLNKQEYNILIKYTDLLFDCWSFFYKEIESNPLSSCIVTSIKQQNDYGSERLKREAALYYQDKRKYVDYLLDNNGGTLERINDYIYDKAIKVDWIKNNIFKSYKKFFNKLNSKQFFLNLKNNRFNIFKMLSSKRYFTNVLLCLFAGRYYKNVSKKPGWQINASFQKKLNAVFDILEKRREQEKPFYISLHTEEPHNYVAFFSYDIDDKKTIDEEINYIKPTLEKCGKNFKGNLCYQLSLTYVDLCVKRLYEKLSKLGLLDNTAIVLITDHGTSYSYYPVRDTVVNNFYKENYKTPFLIWNSNVSNYGECDGLFSAEDVQMTICKSLGLNVPNDYTGLPIYDSIGGRKYVITEYMGPGCPDMLTREVWISIRNNQYCFAFKNAINEEFSYNNLFEAFDLMKDPLEKHNIRNKILNSLSNDSIKELFETVKKRFEEISSKAAVFINNLDNYEMLAK